MAHIADQMHAQGDDQGAMEFYARAVLRSPDDADAHQKLAALMEVHDDNKDAAEQYRILTQLEPDNADYRRAYGRVLIKLNQPADAKTQYGMALASDPSDIRTLNGLGIALDLLGEHAGAQAQYRTALEQKPDDTTTINNLGHSYVLDGSYDQAIKVLEPQDQNPAAPPTLRANLAEAYGMAGMYVDAERMMREDLSPEQVKKNLARFHAAHGKAVAPVAYANLGGFATSDLAQARLDKIKENFAPDIGSLTLAVAPEVDEVGGTPIFLVRVDGFKDLPAAKTFCIQLRKGGAFCKEHEGDKPSVSMLPANPAPAAAVSTAPAPTND